VEELAALGAVVHTCSRKEWETKGFRVTGSVCDVSVRDQRESLVRDVANRFGSSLNILVSIAFRFD
jgi:tropinone reductase I